MTQKIQEAACREFSRQGLLYAREKSWEALHTIRDQIQIGMTETEAGEVAIETLRRHGSTRSWHKPIVRFGKGTLLTFHSPLQKDYRLQNGDPAFLDLGPVWNDPKTQIAYEGDVGDSFVVGQNIEAERCVQFARSLWRVARDKWFEEKLSGQKLYAFMKEASEMAGFELVERVEGHRLSDFPHMQYSRSSLATTEFTPTESLWVLEFQLRDPEARFGAFYEDLLL